MYNVCSVTFFGGICLLLVKKKITNFHYSNNNMKKSSSGENVEKFHILNMKYSIYTTEPTRHFASQFYILPFSSNKRVATE